MGERLYGPTRISKLIAELQDMQKRYGDLPICGEGDPPEKTTIELSPIDSESVAAKPGKAVQVFIQIW